MHSNAWLGMISISCDKNYIVVHMWTRAGVTEQSRQQGIASLTAHHVLPVSNNKCWVVQWLRKLRIKQQL